MTLVVCKKCNFTSFGISKAEAEKEILTFNAYFDTLSKEEQDLYYKGQKSSLKDYACMYCGGTEFAPGNIAPNGSTLSPVVYEEEK